jgi:aerobic-type carbon monoxide dehydrogenase small subunit (CoxS/CutS family)
MKPAPFDYRVPGTLSEAIDLLVPNPDALGGDADADRIRSSISGNLCRCTGFIAIVEAALEARAAYRKADNP